MARIGRAILGIAGIADIARHRRDRKERTYKKKRDADHAPNRADAGAGCSQGSRRIGSGLERSDTNKTARGAAGADCSYDRERSAAVWSEATKMEAFEEIVEWAYTTLPQKIRRLPDFPGIQVVDEPPADVLQDISARDKWPRGTELLGLYSGTLRTKRSFAQVKFAPDLIFVFRGPILRCSKGDLHAEVKQVVWHEVAHWLGFETEEQVEALGL